MLDTPRLGCVNIHASLLPRWRGAAPVQSAGQAGDKEGGVTIVQMDVGLDTGPFLLERVTAIDAHAKQAVAGIGVEDEGRDRLGGRRGLPSPDEGIGQRRIVRARGGRGSCGSR